MKSASERILIDANLIERCHIGIVMGGEGLASPENSSSKVQNNIILDATDIGIALVNAQDAYIVHNTVLGSVQDIHLGKDQRFAGSQNSGSIINNVFSTIVVGTDIDVLQIAGNKFWPESSTERLFVDPERGDFQLAGSATKLLTGPVEHALCLERDFLKNRRDCNAINFAGAVSR